MNFGSSGKVNLNVNTYGNTKNKTIDQSKYNYEEIQTNYETTEETTQSSKKTSSVPADANKINAEARQEKIEIKKANNAGINTGITETDASKINLKEEELPSPEVAIENVKPFDNPQTQEKLNEFSKLIADKAIDEKTNRTHTSEYKYGQWCANFATWVWKNTELDGKSAWEIANLNSSFTSSTGYLMMHFLTADHPDLGFDYTGCPFYDPNVNNNIAFYYNDRLAGFAGKNEGKLPEGASEYTPKPGDIVFFDNYRDKFGSAGHAEDWKPLKYPDDSRQDHTGMVKEVIYDESGKAIGIKTVEGNISNNFYERTIMFDDKNDIYSTGLIGYGTIIDYPAEESENNTINLNN